MACYYTFPFSDFFIINLNWTRMHSSRMPTAHSLPYCTETPLDRDHPGLGPPGQRPQTETLHGQTNTCENITCANFVFGAIKMTLWNLKSICRDWYYIWVPTRTGKMGRHFPVREFWTDWKSQGKSHKILEKSGNFRQKF